MKTEIITEGREASSEFWKSGILYLRLKFTPFLAFVATENKVEVKIVEKAEYFLYAHKDMPDETKVMVQWQGEYKSDFFQTTVGENS